ETPQHFEAVHLGQLQVEQDHARHDADLAPGVTALAKEKVERLGAVARHEQLVRDVALLERAQRQLLVLRVVLDQQDFDFVGEIHARPCSGCLRETAALVARTTPGRSRGAARAKWLARLPENRVPSRPHPRWRRLPSLSRCDRPCRKKGPSARPREPLLVAAPPTNLGVSSVAWSHQSRNVSKVAEQHVTTLTPAPRGNPSLVVMGKPLRVLMVEDSEDDAH